MRLYGWRRRKPHTKRPYVKQEVVWAGASWKDCKVESPPSLGVNDHSLRYSTGQQSILWPSLRSPLVYSIIARKIKDTELHEPNVEPRRWIRRRDQESGRKSRSSFPTGVMLATIMISRPGLGVSTWRCKGAPTTCTMEFIHASDTVTPLEKTRRQSRRLWLQEPIAEASGSFTNHHTSPGGTTSVLRATNQTPPADAEPVPFRDARIEMKWPPAVKTVHLPSRDQLRC